MNCHKTYSALALICFHVASIFSTATLFAQSPTDPLVSSNDIETLQWQIDQLRRELGLLQVPQPAMAPQPAPPPEKKYPDFRITGFFQLDTAYFDQDAASRQVLGDIQDGTTFRRARLAATGNIAPRVSYLMEFDFAQAQARFVDVWGQIDGTPLGNVRIGRFRQPFGMSELTSVRELPFLERPTSFALAPFRQTGIMFFDTALEEQMTWAVSVFRGASDNFGNVYGEDGGYGSATRLTGLLFDTGDECLLHAGIGHSFMAPGRERFLIASQDEIFIGQQSELGLAGLTALPIVNVPPFVSTGPFDVEHLNYFNVETAVSAGSGLLQSEFRWTTVSLPTGQDVTVNAGYITMRYVLTGETIPYNRAAGVFGRVKPTHPLNVLKGCWGAWEIAARASTIDLTPLFGQPGVPGPTRRLNSTNLSLNWYWWTNAKCQFDWVHGDLDDPTFGNSRSNTFASRVQFDF
ncbi:MAG: porin [Pirellulaceae bacterium]